MVLLNVAPYMDGLKMTRINGQWYNNFGLVLKYCHPLQK